MEITLEEYIYKHLKAMGEYSFDKWVDFQENLSNYQYPDRKWGTEFKKTIKLLFVERQEEHKIKVIKLYTKILIEQYDNLKK